MQFIGDDVGVKSSGRKDEICHVMKLRILKVAVLRLNSWLGRVCMPVKVVVNWIFMQLLIAPVEALHIAKPHIKRRAFRGKWTDRTGDQALPQCVPGKA